MAKALGVDIGGTGIKAAVVDTVTGELLTDRVKLFTPEGGEPEAVVQTVLEVIEKVGGLEDGVPVGVCFPAVVKHGRTMSAANVSKRWIGLEAEALFERSLGRDITFINDADAAGYAELHYGAAKGQEGLVILTTLGTGIGSAFLYDGVLIPNTELGHLQMHGDSAEARASYGAKERGDLSWAAWAERLQEYYAYLETLFSPDLFVVGGGVSKNSDDFLPLLHITTPLVPAVHRNNSGIIGAAALAAIGFHA
jgi:polyphosphate glucokinase